MCTPPGAGIPGPHGAPNPYGTPGMPAPYGTPGAIPGMQGMPGYGTPGAYPSTPAVSIPTPPPFKWQQVPGNLLKISARGTHVWGVNQPGDIWTRRNDQWVQIPGKAGSISVGADGTVIATNEQEEVYKWTGNEWNRLQTALISVSVGGDKNMWGLNKKKEIWQWNGTSWTKVEGSAETISVGTDGTVWGTNSTGGIIRRTSTGTWETIPGPNTPRGPSGLSHVSCFDATTVIGNDPTGDVWIWIGQGWVQGVGKTKSIEVAAKSHTLVWALVPSGEIYRHS
eukprot:TRINITY_DN7308_c0_g2_i2.p1 TRINITY_DN7308_c0_g2~~TRINITY_DN7308_c0_g2_i2.p1  ORF type:complete len:325 (+),score=75.69 TRINITY_DN7308_c0_g2_i2:131-976(+)